MAPRRRDFERPFGAFLPFDIAQTARSAFGQHFAGFRGRKDRLARKMPYKLDQIFGPDHLAGPDPGRLGAAGAGADQNAVVFGSGHRGRQRADHGNKRAVQRKFAQRHRLRHNFRGQDLERGQKAQGNGQIEMRPLFRQICRRKVDRDPL